MNHKSDDKVANESNVEVDLGAADDEVNHEKFTDDDDHNFDDDFDVVARSYRHAESSSEIGWGGVLTVVVILTPALSDDFVGSRGGHGHHPAVVVVVLWWVWVIVHRSTLVVIEVPRDLITDATGTLVTVLYDLCMSWSSFPFLELSMMTSGLALKLALLISPLLLLLRLIAQHLCLCTSLTVPARPIM